MSLLYNQLLSYNAPSVTYGGSIEVSPASILSSIQIGDSTIAVGAINNQSSLTTIGLISYDLTVSGQATGVIFYDLAPTGQSTMEITSSPGTAILTLEQI
jgi:hypothetical protein